jgi:hypothetical protein
VKSMWRWAPIVLVALVVACSGDGPQPTAGTPGGAPDGSTVPAGGVGGQPGVAGGTDAGRGGSGGVDAQDAPGLAGAGGPTDGNGPAMPGGVIVVQAFRATQVYYDPMDNRRKVYAEVDLPTGQWKTVSLQLHLGCPTGGCDRFDRWGFMGVASGEGMAESITEIARFATPFGGAVDWTTDVTGLSPILAAHRRLVVQIDTWVGPTRPPGAGWLVDATLTFTPGIPERRPIQVIPLWPVGTLDVGDPANPPTIPARMVQIPAEAESVELRSFVTGHGQGNFQNCAEFCPKMHTYTVGGMTFGRLAWRDDCASFCTLTRPPGSTVQFCQESPTGVVGSVRASRANWCPGALVVPWSFDVSAAARPGLSVNVSYAPELYENTCRPTAPICQGCAFGTPCAYDGSLHTSPLYLHSALLIVYGPALR